MRWIGKNLLPLLLLGFAIWAYLAGYEDVTRYFVVLAMLAGVSAQITELRDELREVRNARDEEKAA